MNQQTAPGITMHRGRRAFDLGVALVAVVLLTPLMLLRAAAAWITTGRCVVRVTHFAPNGREFSMHVFSGDIPGRGLASLWDVVRGEMVIAGPRAVTVAEHRLAPAGPEGPSRAGILSPSRLRRKLGLIWESSADADETFAENNGPMAALGLILRTAVARLLSGRGDSPAPATLRFFGVPVANALLGETLDWLMDRARSATPTHVAFVNPDCLNSAFTQESYRRTLIRADRVLPDGIGIRVACRMRGERMLANLNGTDLFPLLCERAAAHGLGIFLLGGRPGVAEAAGEAMLKRFPNLTISGTRDGYFADAEREDVIREVNESGASMLFVAMGAPRQELWLAQHSNQLRPALRLGVGGLFDFYSGRIRRAPGWVRELGLEWVWRLAMEPRRMWRRYVVGNPVFLYRIWRTTRAERGLLSAPRPTPVGSAHRMALHAWAAALRRRSRRLSVAVGSAGKRILDVAGAALGLVLLGPIFALVAAAIKIDSPGPVLFRQKRVGMYGKRFGMWKFRSMYIDAEARKARLLASNEMSGGVLFKMKEDPRITRVGKLIRRASIDELPQLWNVLRGDMSLVGPRPALPSEVSQYSLDELGRLHAKPGITCIWQVSGRSDIPFERQVQLDLDYIHGQSLALDVGLLVKTIPAVVLGRGAY
jgi:exopolysaccharide biosynthesis WecB/TagA/CpsF family protein